jgi:hypothetical protein
LGTKRFKSENGSAMLILVLLGATVPPILYLALHGLSRNNQTGIVASQNASATRDTGLGGLRILRGLFDSSSISGAPTIDGSGTYWTWNVTSAEPQNGALYSFVNGYDQAYVTANNLPPSSLASLSVKAFDSTAFRGVSGLPNITNFFQSAIIPPSATENIIFLSANLTDPNQHYWVKTQTAFTSAPTGSSEWTSTNYVGKLTSQMTPGPTATTPSCNLTASQRFGAAGFSTNITVQATEGLISFLEIYAPYNAATPLSPTSTIAPTIANGAGGPSLTNSYVVGSDQTIMGVVAGPAGWAVCSMTLMVTANPPPPVNPTCYLNATNSAGWTNWSYNHYAWGFGSAYFTAAYDDASTTLSWAAANSSGCTLSGSGYSGTNTGMSGSVSLNANQLYDQLYTLVCPSNQGMATCLAAIVVQRFCWGVGGPLGPKYGLSNASQQSSCFNSVSCPNWRVAGTYHCQNRRPVTWSDFPSIPDWDVPAGCLCIPHAFWTGGWPYTRGVGNPVPPWMQLY